jgi:hypothetical protein
VEFEVEVASVEVVEFVLAVAVAVVRRLQVHGNKIFVLVKESLGQLDGNGVELDSFFFHWLHDIFIDLVHHLIAIQHQLLVQ